MSARRRKPKPPCPGVLRRPSGSFGWLEARLLHGGWLARCGPEASATLLLLALAADRSGSSFYGRERMGDALGLDRPTIDAALARLLDLGLVVHKPWCPGHPDGVWQLMPPSPASCRAAGEPASLAISIESVLSQLGLSR